MSLRVLQIFDRWEDDPFPCLSGSTLGTMSADVDTSLGMEHDACRNTCLGGAGGSDGTAPYQWKFWALPTATDANNMGFNLMGATVASRKVVQNEQSTDGDGSMADSSSGMDTCDDGRRRLNAGDDCRRQRRLTGYERLRGRRLAPRAKHGRALSSFRLQGGDTLYSANYNFFAFGFGIMVYPGVELVFEISADGFLDVKPVGFLQSTVSD